MMETWLEERGWERVKRRLPKECRWEMQEAKRKNKKCRAMGGIVMGIRKELIGKKKYGNWLKGHKYG